MRWLAIPFAVLLLAGCARVSVTTKVAADGSFTRTIRYALKKADGGLSQGGPQTIEDAFKVPSGAGVTVTKKTEKDELIAEVKETVAAGAAPLKDITLLNEKKTPAVESTVSVKKLDDGRLEYTEHLHWVGPIPPNEMQVPPEMRATVKKSLPERYQKTEIIDGVNHDLLVAMVRAFFGPSEPIFFEILTNTDAAERRMIGVIVPKMIASMKQRMPDLTDAEALSAAKAIVAELKLSDFAKEKASAAQPSPNPDAKKSDNSEMTPILVAVGFPGTVVESNGITDPLTGEIYWSLYPPSLMLGDIDLKVIAKP